MSEQTFVLQLHACLVVVLETEDQERKTDLIQQLCLPCYSTSSSPHACDTLAEIVSKVASYSTVGAPCCEDYTFDVVSRNRLPVTCQSCSAFSSASRRRNAAATQVHFSIAQWTSIVENHTRRVMT